MKVFLTGATGLLGRQLAFQLIDNGYEVIALCRPGHESRKSNVPNTEKIEWIEGDIWDIPALQQGFENADYAIHAAGLVSFDPRDRTKLLKTNAEGTANVVNCALQAPKFQKLIHISSVASLSASKPMPTEINEMQGFNPDDDTSDYAYSKNLAEMEIARGVVEGLKAAMVNPSIILSAGGADESSASLIDYAKKGRPFYPTGWLNYVDVRDVARISIRLLTSGHELGERLVVSAGHLPYRNFLNMVADVFQSERPWIEAKNWITAIGWRVDGILSVLTGKRRFLTRFTAKSANRKVMYKSLFIDDLWPDFRFIALEETIKWIADTRK